MLHCCFHLSRLAVPSAKAKEGHLHPIVQGEGSVHCGLCELQADLAAAAYNVHNVHNEKTWAICRLKNLSGGYDSLQVHVEKVK